MNEKHGIILLPSLAGGGAEKAGLDLYNELKKNYKLVLIENVIDFPVDRKNEDITIIGPEHKNPLMKMAYVPVACMKLVLLVYKHKTKLVMSYTEEANIVNVVAKIFTGHKAVISQHAPPDWQYHRKGMFGRVILLVGRIFFKNADHVIAVSDGIKKSFVENYRIAEKKVSMIPNPIKLNQSLGSEIQVKLPSKFMLNVARITFVQKTQNKILKAFSMIESKFPECSLVFAGVGPDSEKLQQMIKDFGLEKRVFMIGFQKNLLPIFKKAEFSLLCSDYEAFGMVLVESMSAGCAVLASDIPFGPGDILDNSKYGLLIPDNEVESIAKGMEKMLSDDSLRLHYKKQGEIRAREYASVDITSKYESVFNQLLSHN